MPLHDSAAVPAYNPAPSLPHPLPCIPPGPNRLFSPGQAAHDGPRWPHQGSGRGPAACGAHGGAPGVQPGQRLRAGKQDVRCTDRPHRQFLLAAIGVPCHPDSSWASRRPQRLHTAVAFRSSCCSPASLLSHSCCTPALPTLLPPPHPLRRLLLRQRGSELLCRGAPLCYHPAQLVMLLC